MLLVAAGLLMAETAPPNVSKVLRPASLIMISGIVLGSVAVVATLIAGAAILAAGQLRQRSIRRRRRVDDVSMMARILVIALSAGLPLGGALRMAQDHVGDELGDEIERLVRRGARVGIAEALRTHQGAIGRLALLLSRAQVTGASVAAAVSSYVDELRAEERASSLESARRLPVKLTIPLALLILPGFVVLTVGPSVLESARRLLGPVLPVP